MRRAILPLLLLPLLSMACHPTRAADPSPGDGELTFCHYGPKVKVLEAPKAQEGSKTQEVEAPGCEAMLKIQGLMWDCMSSVRVETQIPEFRDKLAAQASQVCEKACAARGENCHGKFIIPAKCGLQTDREDAVAMGERLGCRKDCGGQAFAYCSLYDAAFRTDDPERVAKQKPNCHCELLAK